MLTLTCPCCGLVVVLLCRSLLLGQLRASGFVRARGAGDIRDLNTNSDCWAVVKAALCAGTYPNIMKVDRGSSEFNTEYVININMF